MTALRNRWPAALGFAAAVLVLIFAADRETASTAVLVAALCYLGAAAFARRWVAWAGVVGFSVVVTAAQFMEISSWVALAVVGVVLLGLGFIVGVPRRPLVAQAAAAVGYGIFAVVALYVPETAGGVMAGLALAAHAGWDTVNFARNTVVPRSLSEACMALDVPLGIGVAVIAVAG
ncbi:hypothetical protein Ade02nite_80890 [Paractinoplanes deccanensis]|uniref:Metal-dependent phosphohydrolase 7TM intracellular domain-containing protein n=1 Tax=Paractinoplanes deccanensis TaxID=113561 RepID=A0ABQ3YHH2_9ACTN|nr:hypothetical protein [Actinoplanes deccanensis]GID79448.1 hypothetical protein Ade02nite_80890 [Actinoplanes deccanensis]